MTADSFDAGGSQPVGAVVPTAGVWSGATAGPSGHEAVLARIPELVPLCAAAVDPLEIAARLEASGMSNQVVLESYGHPDVFGLAEALYVAVPFEAAPAPVRAVPPRGSVKDLARGALFAIPTLMYSVAIRGFGLDLAWWSLAVGLICGWALGQAVASFGWAMRGRSDHDGEPALVVSALVSAAVVSGAVSLAITLLVGRGAEEVAVAMLLTLYMVASSILLLYEEELRMALALLPGTAAVVVVETHWPFAISGRVASAVVITSVMITTVSALRRAVRRGWKVPMLGPTDRANALRYLLHGLSCALFTSTIIAFGYSSHGGKSRMALAVWPLLLTLGVMEWQLRSFRSRASGLLAGATTLRQFARGAQRLFLRSFAVYLALLGALSVAVFGMADFHHPGMLPLLLVAQGTLGVAFFIALILVASGRIDVVLRCWAAGLGTCAAYLVAGALLRGQITSLMGITGALLSSYVALCLLLTRLGQVVGSPLSYY